MFLFIALVILSEVFDGGMWDEECNGVGAKGPSSGQSNGWLAHGLSPINVPFHRIGDPHSVVCCLVDEKVDRQGSDGRTKNYLIHANSTAIVIVTSPFYL
jgi:hypothetical protein